MPEMDAESATSPPPTRVFDQVRVHSYAGGHATFVPETRGRDMAPPLLLVHARSRGALERGRELREAPAGSLCFLPGDAPVTFSGPGGNGVVVLELPRQVVVRSRDRIASATRMVIASDSGAPALLRSFLDTLVEQLPSYRPDHPGWVQNCLCEMVERVLTECATPHLSQAERALVAAKTFIRSHLTDIELAPEQVAHQASVSLRTLNRLFAAEGDSVCGCIRQQRLERCRADLSDPGMAGRSIGQIAAGWGFLDPAHFSRVFKDAYGASPRAYRLQHGPVPEQGQRSDVHQVA